MGHRYVMPAEMTSDHEFRMMEVVTLKKNPGLKSTTSTQALVVDNHRDTLKFVQEHMNKFVDNVIGIKKMEDNDQKNINHNSRLFEKNLEPLFKMISRGSEANVLEKLSTSLKKALLLMAMDRYSSNRDSICKALGISSEKLEKEIASCGLKQFIKTI